MTEEVTRAPATTSADFGFSFTASQWQELVHQALAFKYIVSGVPLPPELISTLLTTTTTPFTTSNSSTPFSHQHPLPTFGWGCFQVGHGTKIDTEPGRCRRTDGKKWRCSKEASPNSKYCEKHINRGRSKSKSKSISKKNQIQDLNPTNTTSTTTAAAAATNTSTAISCSVSPPYTSTYCTQKCPSSLLHQDQPTSFCPFLSPRSSSQQSAHSSMSDQNQPAPLWVEHREWYDQQPSKTITFEF